MTLAQALIGEHVAPRERGRYAGYFATVFALASTSGPVLGAYLTEHVVVARDLPHQHSARRDRRRARDARPARGAAVAARDRSAPTSRAPSCSASRRPHSCSRSRRAAIASPGCRCPWRCCSRSPRGAFAALAWWERRHHDPIIPIHFLKVPAIARADAVVLCFGACLFPLDRLPAVVPAARQGHRHRRVGRAAPAHHSRAGDVRGDHGSPRHAHRARARSFRRSAFRWCASCSPHSPSRSIARPRR